MTKSKPLVGTWYAYQDRKSGLWLTDRDYEGAAFTDATLDPHRFDVDEKLVRVVTVRCRALSTRTKASPKRTR